MTQEEMVNLNSLIFIKEFEFIRKKTSHKNIPGPDSFTNKFYYAFKKDIIPVLEYSFGK